MNSEDENHHKGMDRNKLMSSHTLQSVDDKI